MTADVAALEPWIETPTLCVLRRAETHSSGVLSAVAGVVDAFIDARGVDASSLCVTVVGSVGRMEALEASDVDLLPVWTGDQSKFEGFCLLMDELRCELREKLALDVARGRSVLATASLNELADPKTIGGDLDQRQLLTARVLLLTEARHVGGGVDLATVRRCLLDAYAGQEGTERSAGRHPMAVCNDIARYYRTVCVDYKSVAESKPDNWCLRNVKLRHARKFWYFASILPIASIGASIPTRDRDGFVIALQRVLALPPFVRVFEVDVNPSAPALLGLIGQVVDRYAWYLDRMAAPATREALRGIAFEDREDATGGPNPYALIHEESKRMHESMRGVLDRLHPDTRRRVFDWFLL